MKNLTTKKLTLAGALLSTGCTLGVPPYVVEMDSFNGRAILAFNIEGENVEALASQAISGTLRVSWRDYEARRQMLVEFAKREGK